MTAIAYKDGFLAADRGIFDEDDLILGEDHKIYDLGGGWFVAAAGYAADIERVVELFQRTKHPPLHQFESACKRDCEGILAGPGGVFSFTHDTGIEPAPWPYLAVGACTHFLMGLMAAGKSAEQAVIIASKNHAFVRPPVDVVECGPKKRAPRRRLPAPKKRASTRTKTRK